MALSKYRIIGVEPGPVRFKKQVIDLSLIDDIQAAELFEQGLSYIEEVPTVPSPTPAPVAKTKPPDANTTS